MSFKKWMLTFLSALVAVTLAIAGFNVFVDPFGVFGDRVFDDYGYNMTSNPRISKIEYLKTHHSEYDSYIIGCSKTSSFSVEKLSEYYDASFYSMLMYGGDMYDIEKTALYIIDTYSPKNIIINMGLEETTRYNVESDATKQNLHPLTEGKNAVPFYLKYAFLNPQYAIDKLKNIASRDYLLTSENVFLPETGVYDKSVRDVSYIGSVDEFLGNNPAEFASSEYTEGMGDADACLESISRIVDACDKKSINFKLFISPISHYELRHYPDGKLADFFTRLSDITPFYDFSGYGSYITTDPRYYYDEYHFRNCVGDMALAFVFKDDSVFVPDGFGAYVTPDNVAEHIDATFTEREYSGENEHRVPVLLYHNVVNEYDGNSMNMSAAAFDKQMKALVDAGYTAISAADMKAYVNGEKTLPEKSVMITFDDGYESNFKIAYPILKKYGLKATIFTVGETFGKDTLNDIAITPHFDSEQAKEMTDSGVIELGSHTYGMHQLSQFYENPRDNATPKKGESDADFAAAFMEDVTRFETEVFKTDIIAYPHGKHETVTDVCARRAGFNVTFTVDEGINTIVKGLPQSLYNLKRISVYEDTAAETLINKIGG